MKNRNAITVLVLLIAIASIIATTNGIFTSDGPGQYEHQSIRGEKIIIYGKGLYQHMSEDVAIQGIAQDYITLFAGVPLILISLFIARKNSLRGLLMLAGVTAYFLVTYLFYIAIAMYNSMFLVYVFLLGTSFFAFIRIITSIDKNYLINSIKKERVLRNAGIFLIINAFMVALLWLGIVVPPLLDGSIIPHQVQHYTTLIVQGFDLGILLPSAFLIGYSAIKKNFYGYLFTIIYMIFLSVLMTALVSKILFMAKSGVNVIPVIFIMPTIAIVSITFSVLLLRNVKEQ